MNGVCSMLKSIFAQRTEKRPHCLRKKGCVQNRRALRAPLYSLVPSALPYHYWSSGYATGRVTTRSGSGPNPDRILGPGPRAGVPFSATIQTSINRPANDRHWILVGVVKKWLLIHRY